ncbi:MAG TPA: DUF2939 domain-containing protein, partial [Caulobacteraceae bacterium]|nr:DUF2939 domain-containing protein [Caulobacteraceae bacterium]
MSDAGHEDVEALKAEVARLKAAQSAPPQPIQPIQGGGSGGLIGLVIALVVLGGAAVAGYYFASPFLALEALRSAAKSGNRDRLDALVDFPVLRANLKSEVSAKMLKSMQDDPSLQDNPYAGLGAVIAPVIVDRLVDAYVTPDTISAMVDTGKPQAPGSSPGAATPTNSSKLKTSMGYADLDHFRAKLFDASDPKNQITLTMERRNLFAWKLVRLDFDVDTAQSDNAKVASAASAAADTATAASQAASAAQDAVSAANAAEPSQALAAAPAPAAHHS